ncbi:hypothetical protein CASFOL_027369 [Castilleja foliolosa]|uniref:GDSL esterase/lipase At5g03610-like n=1 Tax=Castilleja foliolosa TaxID=1961234 RepID=A0ABD3CFF3_9LAMI
MALFNNLFISFFCFCFLLISGLGIHASSPSHHVFRPAKLFVFGDSYADTGNIRKSLGNSWSPPYGNTLPGKPAGRFSDGRVFTDYLARFMRIKSPLAYELMKLGGKKLENGMNFAYGGSGVFDTFGTIVPNVSTQIGYFESQLDQSVYTKKDVQSSVVLAVVAGNDYGAYLLRPDATPQGLQNYIPVVINQLVVDLKRIQGLGATRIAVTSLQPLGCLPRTTQTSSFRQCNATENSYVNYHNLLLQQAVAKLNNGSKKSTFFILDLYSSFTTVLQHKGVYQGNLRFETPLKPCCMGINSTYSCGSVDERGQKLYTVCSDPKSSFFWDSSHPSDAGWLAVYTTIKSTLEKFIKLY